MSKKMDIYGELDNFVEENEGQVTLTDVAKHFADYGYQYALQHPQWIPVEERLPKENQSVFICNARHDYGTALYQGGEWFITREYVAINVTHWMEIVPPRKEEQ